VESGAVRLPAGCALALFHVCLRALSCARPQRLSHACASRSIGERLSPYVGAACLLMGLSILWY
jgi:hypothetical protein